jgi:glucosamine--fructose-6-phosphate aminotransferase (isomerizing)
MDELTFQDELNLTPINVPRAALRFARAIAYPELDIERYLAALDALADAALQPPAGLPEWLTPIVSIVPAQLYCYHLTRAKGYDTEAPRSLRKVTRTQ